MHRGTKKIAQKAIAVIVIVAILDVIGVSPAVIIFFLGVGFLVWRAARRAEHQETGRIFDFYISADEILRETERQWYGFEIQEVINRGERILNAMPDPPPLGSFALGALSHRAGMYDEAIEYLAPLVEQESAKEHLREVPSPQLRRYVELLRRMEREPATAPQAVAAVRSLERARRKSASELLAHSRQQLAATTGGPQMTTYPPAKATDPSEEHLRLGAVNAPPPISEVLHDVYQEDQKTA
jgi:hypothetical protein